jgi:hypothetical protein
LVLIVTTEHFGSYEFAESFFLKNTDLRTKKCGFISNNAFVGLGGPEWLDWQWQVQEGISPRIFGSALQTFDIILHGTPVLYDFK